MGLLALILLLLLLSGDVHENPGPDIPDTSSTSSSEHSEHISDFLNFSNHLSIVHYNVQSIYHKLDILQTELNSFDILSFSETWLSAETSNNDISLLGYQIPERKDRSLDRHGGVIVYVKESLPYVRRADLEIINIECIWIEIKLCNRQNVLFGIFYRPPNSTTEYTSNLQDSIGLAVNTGIQNIIITGDFNLNALSPTSRNKIDSICYQNNLSQCIQEPTHFTENSSSIIDLLLVSDKRNIVCSGVGEPFLLQNVRYHCPVFGIFKFNKPKVKTFKRKIWQYNQANFNNYRLEAEHANWNSLRDVDINTYALNITSAINKLSKDNIPSKDVNVNPLEPPWMSSAIKKAIRKRKRAYRKAKRTNNRIHWHKFRRLRNDAVLLIRTSKQNYFNQLSEKLKSTSPSSKDWGY